MWDKFLSLHSWRSKQVTSRLYLQKRKKQNVILVHDHKNVFVYMQIQLHIHPRIFF